jgi:hypothetical protein
MLFIGVPITPVAITDDNTNSIVAQASEDDTNETENAISTTEDTNNNDDINNDVPSEATLSYNIIDMEPYLTVEDMYITYQNNVYYPDDEDGVFSGFTMSKGVEFGLGLAFGEVEIKAGQVIQYKIPSGIMEHIKATTTDIRNSNNEVVGVATIDESGLITFNPDDEYLTKHKDATTGLTTITNNTVTVYGLAGEDVGNDPNKKDNIIDLGKFTITLPFDYADYNSRINIAKEKNFF